MGYGLSEIWTQSLAQRQHSGEVSYHNCVVPFLGSIIGLKVCLSLQSAPPNLAFTHFHWKVVLSFNHQYYDFYAVKFSYFIGDFRELGYQNPAS